MGLSVQLRADDRNLAPNADDEGRSQAHGRGMPGATQFRPKANGDKKR